MTINYTTLVADKSTDGSIKSWVNYSLVPADTVLTMAQAFIYERLRAREMRAEGAVTLAAAGDSITLTTYAGFLDPIELRLDGDGVPLEYVHENLLGRSRDDTGALFSGTVSRWTIMDEKIMFDVASEEARAGKFWYYKTPTALGSGNETNFLTVRYPVLLIDACMAFGNGFRKLYAERDKMLMIVGAEIDQANMAAEMARRGQTQR